jgi:hypothetical protein
VYPRKYSDRLENWDLFVLRHQKTPNIIVHIFSFLFFWVSPILAFTVSYWWLLGFFGSGLIGSVGHYLFKDGTIDVKEATSSLQVVHFSSLVVIFFILGKYTKHIELATQKYDLFKSGKITSVADPEMMGKLGK